MRRLPPRIIIGSVKAGDTILFLQPNCATVSTKRLGEILIGCPPEIIKWFMSRGKEIPSVIVLPRDFTIDNTLNVEPEFPVYGNFFIHKRKAVIVGTKAQLRRIRTILRESFVGPREAKEGRRERAFLRGEGERGRPLELDDLVDFLPFEPERKCVDIDGVTIRAIRPGCLEVWEDGRRLGEVDTTQFTMPPSPVDLFGEAPLEPPTFGVTFVGTGSGFTPGRRTTSFVLWINGQGILVDPVKDPWTELGRLGIEEMDVPSVLLTHCHADHDAGMIRAVLHRRRLRLVTSRVVFQSFLRKARALIGQDIQQYLDFMEINPGQTARIGEALLRVSSAFHSIPTIRFEVVFRDEGSHREMKIAYSADTCLDRARIETMHRRRIIDDKRLDELLHFGLDADLFIHEAGHEAIHTAIEEFSHFPKDVRKRLILVHTGIEERRFEGIRVAQEGETIALIPPRRSLPEGAGLLASNPVFEGVPRERLIHVAKRSELVRFKAGQRIIRQGERGDRFYVIAQGKVKVTIDAAIKAVLGKGDYFGEISLLKGDVRSASVEAVSDGLVLALDRDTFRMLVQEEPSVTQRLEKVLHVRPLVSQLTFLRGLSADQMTRLSVCLARCKGQRGDRVVEENQKGDAFFILASGEATVWVRGQGGRERIIAKLGPGDVFGEIALIRGIPRTATVEITSDSAELLRLEKRDFDTLMESIPSVSFYLHRISSERLQRLARRGRSHVDDPG